MITYYFNGIVIENLNGIQFLNLNIKTALELAKEKGNQEIIQLLMGYMSDANK